jgi:hypothetical protein
MGDGGWGIGRGRGGIEREAGKTEGLKRKSRKGNKSVNNAFIVSNTTPFY